MKQFIIKYTPNLCIETLFRLQAAIIYFKDFAAHPPILIYQMGKVGSSSVYRSLKQAGLKSPIYQIHFLDPGNIRNTIQTYYRKSKILQPKHLFISRVLADKLLKPKQGQLKIISLVRDPIARAISDLFENADLLADNLHNSAGYYNEKKMRHYLEDLFAGFDEQTDYAATWFDREIKKVFNIDVYDHPFDHRAGFSIIKTGNVELLILKMETLSTAFDTAMRLLLSTTSNIPLLNSNVGNSKPYSNQYQQIKSALSIPEKICRKIYATQYCRHFYNEAEIEAFVKKWSGTANPQKQMQTK